jgi:hypothetical protein
MPKLRANEHEQMRCDLPASNRNRDISDAVLAA